MPSAPPIIKLVSCAAGGPCYGTEEGVYFTHWTVVSVEDGQQRAPLSLMPLSLLFSFFCFCFSAIHPGCTD